MLTASYHHFNFGKRLRTEGMKTVGGSNGAGQLRSDSGCRITLLKGTSAGTLEGGVAPLVAFLGQETVRFLLVALLSLDMKKKLIAHQHHLALLRR